MFSYVDENLHINFLSTKKEDICSYFDISSSGMPVLNLPLPVWSGKGCQPVPVSSLFFVFMISILSFSLVLTEAAWTSTAPHA
jgi:hypothetical protein